LAACYDHKVNIWPIATPNLNHVDDDYGVAFRKSTAYYRGNDSVWLRKVGEYNVPYNVGLFIRGFGGEILRGFYQTTQMKIAEVNSKQLSRAYDVNAGSNFTRTSFDEFIEISSFKQENFLGRDVNDLFYWEHRMGTWGSIAMSEADLAARSLVGYNSRNLYDKFFGLDFALRDARKPFYDIINRFSPEISAVKVI